MAENLQQPVELLLRMQRDSLAAGHAMPEQQEVEPRWGGLAFGIGPLRLVTELTSVTDVVDCPMVTYVPRTQPWLRGIANVRGSLYSIVDLGLFLGHAQPTSEASGTLLVLNVENLGCALLVERVFGMRYFNEQTESQIGSVLDRAVQPYVEKAFLRDAELWGVFDIHRFIQADPFRRVVG